MQNYAFFFYSSNLFHKKNNRLHYFVAQTKYDAITPNMISNPETSISKHEITNSDHAITKSSRQTNPKSISHHFILKTITSFLFTLTDSSTLRIQRQF